MSLHFYERPTLQPVPWWLVKNLPAMWETWVWSLGWEDLLEKGKATHSSILAWRIPWTVESMGSQSHDWVTFSHMETTCILKSKTGTAKPRPWNHTQHLRIKLPDLTMSVSICALSWFSSCIPGGSVVENLPAMQETWVQSLDGEDPLEKGMATHSSIFSWRVAWTEEPGRLQSMGQSLNVWLSTVHQISFQKVSQKLLALG